jgi:nitronate monooxygenase
MRPLRNTERVLNNAAAESLLEKEQRLGSDLKFEDIIDEVAGVYPKIMLDGDMDAGVWSCGMVAGLIDDIPTCKQLIDTIMQEADDLINRRLASMTTPDQPGNPVTHKSSRKRFNSFSILHSGNRLIR